MAHASRSALQLTAIALALSSIGAQAATYTWLNDSDTDPLLLNWSLPTNWSPLGPPAQGGDVVITVTGTKTITHSLGNDSINTLNFEASAVNPNAVLLINSGSSLIVTSGGTNGGVIRADNGTMSFTGGTLVNNGTLNAINNGVVSIANATVQGGTLSTASGGSIQFGNGSTIDGKNNGFITNLGALQINQGSTVYGTGTVTNNGSIVVGANADFRMINSDTLTLNGTGTLTLASVTGQNAAQLFTDNGTTITNGASHTIQGAGNFGTDRTVINNQGTITANVSGATLTVDPTGGTRGNVGLTNTGTLRAEGGGSLVLNSGTYYNQGGTITGITGSQVTLNNADIQGGTLAGNILATNGAVLDGVTSAGVLKNTGALTIAAGTTVYQTGTVNNTGTIVVGANADLRAINADTMTFTGNGTLTLASVAGQNAAQLYTDNSTLVTNGAGHTIDGAGNLGIGRTNFLNQGNVLADNTASGTALNVSAAATFTNSGVLRADGGTLNLQQGTFINGTTIDAIHSGVVNITGGSTVIQGGTLNTASGGQMNIGGNARLDGGPGNGAINNTGTLNEVAGATVFANGTLNNTGAIIVGPNADFRMINSDSLTLTGTGKLTLASVTGQNVAQLFTDNGTTITNGAGHTIQGAGNFGLGRTNIVNQGSVLANDATSGIPLNVSVASTFTNSGVLRADGGTLNLQQGTFINSTTIDAIHSGVVNITGGSTVIQGGTLNTASGGQMNIGGNARLDGGPGNGAINNTGTLNEVAGATVFANGTINNTGAIIVGPNADFRMINSDSLTLTGTGKLTLASVIGQNVAQLFTDNGTTITNGAGHTIQGAGNFGLGRTNIVNQGSVLANDATSGIPLNVSVASTFTNSGVLRADGGTLNLQQGTFINGTTIDAIHSGVVNITGGSTVIQGGTLNTASGGQMNIGGNARLDGGPGNGAINNTGTLNEVAGATVFANGTLNNTGAIIVGLNADFRMINSDSLTLTGTGKLTLASVPGQNVAQLFTDNGTTITNGAGHTIDGAGNFGLGRTIVSNSGFINADSSGQTLNLDTVGPVSNLSTGVLQASNGGTLNIAQAVTGTGTIQTDSGGKVVLNQSAQVGRLINNATLDVGDYNVTVSSDYNNANFGTGNNFNKHAGVVSYGTPLPATTGQAYILASGNVAQAVTGANVTHGTDASPTLTIGNVRVGGTTYNYQVANTGTDGPSIRGALQTGVNGGNITDSRLSGSGVTAGNYGPIATGANGGNLGVTFTASSAGALAPLSGQAVHIANNFDNVGEQTLNIALASGAAAYNVAVGNATPTPLVFGNVRVGGTNSQALTIGNTAAAGAYSEDLNASFGASSGAAAGSGSVTGVVAGTANTGALKATLSTATAGAISGAVTVNYTTAGTVNGVSNGLGTLGAGSQTINVSGNVYNVAVGSTTPTPVIIANQRVNGTASQSLTVANTAAAGNYTEALNASIGGTSGMATGSGGPVNNIAAGASNTGGLSVGVNATSSGAKTGVVTIAYQSDGTGSNGHSGLSAISAGSQGITVSGNVYQTAAGTLLTAPLNFGVVQVGQVVSQTLSIRNSATGASGYVEDLNASFGAATGTGANRITGTGSVNGLAAGATNSNGLTVGVNTSSAGMVNASIAVNYVSAGAVNGVSNGLGTLAVGSSSYGVSGTIQGTATVVDQANPVINNSPIALGNVRINSTSPTGLVSVTNQATGNQQAALNASITGNAPVTASGSFNGLAPGATNNTSLAVGIDTSSAGSKNGTATIAFVSDASNVGCTTACQMQLASQNVAVTGAVYRLANPTVANTPITVAARVGSASPTTSIAVTNTSPDVYTEGLSVTRGATSAGFTSSGSITNLVAGGSSNAIGVTLNTMTAGTFSGTQALSYVSTGAGTDGAADLSIGSGSVTLNGKVYTTAVAQNNSPSPIDFGIVHVGESATKGVSVTNGAQVTALNDVLVASAAGATGPFNASGNLGAGLAAGQTSTSGLQVGLNTTTAGNYSGNATFSAASHDSDLTDAALANLAVSLVGQVNNYASDTFSKTSGGGTLSQSGSTFVLDYGTVAQGSGTITSSLVATNNATGPADVLAGNFQFMDAADFGEMGFGAFTGLMAGMSDGPLSFSFSSATLGTFMDTIILHGVGSNASGYAGGIGDLTLIVRGTVNAMATPPNGNVPEPDSLLLLGLGLPLLFVRRRRSQRPH